MAKREPNKSFPIRGKYRLSEGPQPNGGDAGPGMKPTSSVRNLEYGEIEDEDPTGLEHHHISGLLHRFEVSAPMRELARLAS